MTNVPIWSPSALVVQVKANGKLSREETLMAGYASTLGIPVHQSTEKLLERGKFRLEHDMCAIGSVPFVRNALRQVGADLPAHSPYPEVLSDILFREVSRLSSLKHAKSIIASGKKLFVKPAEGWKRFTGFVAEMPDDFRFNGASLSKPVWISDPIHFLSEWRAYVVAGELADLRFADHGGDREIKVDTSVVIEAIRRLSTVAGSPQSYVIDFGVIPGGRTALIEVNDGFSFGAYSGVSAAVYWNVTVSRWHEIVTHAATRRSPS